MGRALSSPAPHTAICEPLLTIQPLINDDIARRNAWVLFATQALAGACPTIVFGVSGIVGLVMLKNQGLPASYATVPVTLFMLGNMLSSIPASFYMARVGRRVGFITGCGFGMLGGILGCWAIVAGSFWGFSLAMMPVGVQLAFVGYMRYAAADIASPALKPKMISRVLAGGVLAAIIGPSVSILMSDLLSPVQFAGAFLGAALLSLLGAIALTALKSPPMPRASFSAGRPLGEIVSNVRFVAAVGCGVVGYVLMNFVMTAAPIAMVGCGLTFNDAQHGLQLHVIAMYAPSFVTGSLIARYGSAKVTGFGFALLLGCAIVGLAGLTRWHFFAGLVLLGVGWNFAYIGATALIAGLHTQEERAKVQAANDFTVFTCVTLGSFASGSVLALGSNVANGWGFVNMLVVPLSLVALVLLALSTLRQSRLASS